MYLHLNFDEEFFVLWKIRREKERERERREGGDRDKVYSQKQDMKTMKWL